MFAHLYLQYLCKTSKSLVFNFASVESGVFFSSFSEASKLFKIDLQYLYVSEMVKCVAKIRHKIFTDHFFMSGFQLPGE